jgi:uncharacterized RDD family membrane protein YckC
MNRSSKEHFGQIAFFTERMLAAFVDVAIVVGLSLFPKIGWLFGLIYFLFKDCLPLLKGQSFGRKLFKLRIVTKLDGKSLVNAPDKALIRQIIFLIPLLNLYEFYCFFFKSERLGDVWTDTTVVKN